MSSYAVSASTSSGSRRSAPSRRAPPSVALSDLGACAAEYRQLSAAASERLRRFEDYRSEANAVRDPAVKAQNPDISDYGRRPNNRSMPQRHRIPLPLGKAMTVKHAYRIAGALPDIYVDQREESPEENHRSDTMEKIAWAIMSESKVETAFSSAAWNASEVGSACFDLYFDYTRNMPIFRSVDPAGILEVRGSEDPHDFHRIYRFWKAPVASIQLEYRGKTFRGEPIPLDNISSVPGKDGVAWATIVQMCDREQLLRFVCWADREIGLYELVHNYGFSPYVVIPNIGPYEDVWGWADYEFVRSIAYYIQQLFSREADVLKAVAAGAYQEDGTGMASSEIAKIIANGGIASIKQGRNIQPIQAADMPSFAESHSDRAMTLMKMLGFSPDAAWGLPGSGSGTDRGLQLQPLLEYTAMKQLNWQTGLNRLFSMAYQMIERKMVGNSTYRGATPKGRGGTRQPFSLFFGQSAAPTQSDQDGSDGIPTLVDLPNTPKELFDGDYNARFVWRNRVDPEDPQYVASELNKFQTGAQSLETTLENLGVQAPEDEMRRIEAESERFPWINDGRVQMLIAQMRGNAQGQGGGQPPEPGMEDSMDTFASTDAGGQSGALNTDAGFNSLGPQSVGVPYGGA
jgi:hypothetical protein